MRINGTSSRRDGLYLVCLGASVVVLLVIYFLYGPNDSTFEDFDPGYFAARCLIEHCDPYSAVEVQRVYRAQRGEDYRQRDSVREVATRYLYPPTSFVAMIPFALLPWAFARVLWMIVSSGGLLFAALLAWDLAADSAPILSGGFVGFLLANCLVITVLCNPSGMVISLCVIAVWCFLRNRFVFAGILCLALSLAIKPQLPGLVWLYFLLAGGVYRRRALGTLLATASLGLPFAVWAWLLSPQWIQELQSNLQFFSGHGGINDPGPASKIPHTIVDLQVTISCFKDDPHFYNPLTYIICAFPLLIWAYVTLRSRFTLKGCFLAIAAIVPLSMLPLYHHLYDTKLILLAVPATAILWAEGGRMKWISLSASAAAFAFTGDVFQTIYTRLMDRFLPGADGPMEQGLRALLTFPVPVVLLAAAVFYLWVYSRYVFEPMSSDSKSNDRAPIGMAESHTSVHS